MKSGYVLVLGTPVCNAILKLIHGQRSRSLSSNHEKHQNGISFQNLQWIATKLVWGVPFKITQHISHGFSFGMKGQGHRGQGSRNPPTNVGEVRVYAMARHRNAEPLVSIVFHVTHGYVISL